MRVFRIYVTHNHETLSGCYPEYELMDRIILAAIKGAHPEWEEIPPPVGMHQDWGY